MRKFIKINELMILSLLNYNLRHVYIAKLTNFEYKNEENQLCLKKFINVAATTQLFIMPVNLINM